MKTQGGFLITQIKQLSARVFEQLLKEQGINEFNGAQGKILYVLWEHEPVTITEISKMTSLARTTLTGMLDRMEEKGLLERTDNPENRREILIKLTPKARELKSNYLEVSDKTNEIFYKGFTEKDIAEFEERLLLILENLEQYEDALRRRK